MKRFQQIALAALVAGGAAVAMAAPANAGVSIGIGLGGPVVAAPGPYYPACDWRWRPCYPHYWGPHYYGWHGGWRGGWRR
jgi:hypothetical protein